ncbi:hypothetical protein Hanom_Chr13g01220371 [Helianthus anomalus]
MRQTQLTTIAITVTNRQTKWLIQRGWTNQSCLSSGLKGFNNLKTSGFDKRLTGKTFSRTLSASSSYRS